ARSGTGGIFSSDRTLKSPFAIPAIDYVYDMTMFPDGVLALSDDSCVPEYTQTGALLRTFSVRGIYHTGANVAGDGSLCVTDETSGMVYNYSETGALLHSFATPFRPSTLRVAHDGTLWFGASGLFDSHLYHCTPAGQQIASIDTSLIDSSPF